jgi:hypothetical protein
MPTKLPAKQKGEWAEVCFAVEVLRRGWRIARPYGDSGPYDCVVDAGGRLSRVQVKSVEKCAGTRRFKVTVAAGRNRKRGYSARHVDLLAILVIPFRSWYLIPLAALRGRIAISLPGRFEKYREGWGLLQEAGRRR